MYVVSLSGLNTEFMCCVDMGNDIIVYILYMVGGHECGLWIIILMVHANGNCLVTTI